MFFHFFVGALFIVGALCNTSVSLWLLFHFCLHFSIATHTSLQYLLCFLVCFLLSLVLFLSPSFSLSFSLPLHFFLSFSFFLCTMLCICVSKFYHIFVHHSNFTTSHSSIDYITLASCLQHAVCSFAVHNNVFFMNIQGDKWMGKRNYGGNWRAKYTILGRNYGVTTPNILTRNPIEGIKSTHFYEKSIYSENGQSSRFRNLEKNCFIFIGKAFGIPNLFLGCFFFSINLLVGIAQTPIRSGWKITDRSNI